MQQRTAISRVPFVNGRVHILAPNAHPPMPANNSTVDAFTLAFHHRITACIMSGAGRQRTF